MAYCNFTGNADMYGLGIRLGYYLQWYGGIAATYLAQEEVPGARFALALFISATFLALIIQTVQHNLHVIEIYIILLLTFGAYLSLVPLLSWRLLTGCNPLMDPTRFPLVDPGPTHSDLHTILILAVTGFQLWFWFVKVPELDQIACRRYGFVFAKVPLNSGAFQVVNIVLFFILGVAVLVMLAIRIRKLAGGSVEEDEKEEWKEIGRKYGKQWRNQHVRKLQSLNLASSFTTATIVVTATELTIKWNHITDINTLSSAGQLIPFVIGLGVVVRILHVWRKNGFKPSKRRRPRPIHAHQLPPALAGTR